MKYLLPLTLLFISFNIFGVEETKTNLQSFEKSFKETNLQNFTLTDLFTKTSKNINDYKFSKIKIWSIDCGNCLQQIEDQKDFSDTIVINIDEKKEDIQRSCRWIKI
jgi:hypothetical protein